MINILALSRGKKKTIVDNDEEQINKYHRFDEKGARIAADRIFRKLAMA